MTTRTQLAKIEKHLTPRQVVVAYLDEIMRRFRSLSDWVQSAAGNTLQAPLVRVSSAVEEAVRNTTRGQPRDVAARALEGAEREAFFLVHLLLKTTAGLLERAEQYSLKAGLCARSLQAALLQAMVATDGLEAAREPQTGRGDQPPGTEAASGPSVGPGRLGLASVRELVFQHLGELYLQRMVLRAISRSYFGGHAVLFPDDSQWLEGRINTAEALVDEHNGLVRMLGLGPTAGQAPEAGPPADADGDSPLLIDRQAVRENAAASVREEIAFIVRMAKATTLLTLGRNQEGCDLAAKAYKERCPKHG